RIRLHLLGRPEAWLRESDGSWRRLHWPLRRALEVLAYLASSPERRAAKEELVAELWSAASEAVVKRNFHPTLSHLRRGLRDAGEAPPLQLAEGVYALNPEIGWWIDVEELERLSAEGRSLADQSRDEEAAAAWEAAWRLYRGPFLAGSSEPWAAARREEHQRPYLAALRELGSAYERLGRPTEAVDAYRALLVEDPLHEQVHLALMRLYGRGRRDLVRRQYERLSARLREELSSEPLPETTAEYHRLMTERG
ncbi:MAG TPA: BTAD domain-containing putative transcriptional regulator, partial [Thermoanaerobaculia bacterium]|nr:BTAD domain-containing putative transcriptional regulator [Thermoanaerobaculia bacterium]